MASKVMSLSEAVSRFISDGMSLVMGTALEALIPFGVGYEIIRQGKKDLNLIGPISDILFDIMVGAGVARKLTVAWSGNVAAGSGYGLRRAVEEGIPRPVEMEDHSNFTIALGLHAAALGVPFLPTKTALGSDLPRTNPGLIPFPCPFTGERLMAVRAIRPDLAIVHVQRSDEEGNAHLWGCTGVTEDAVMASEGVIVTSEEVVPSNIIRSDPNRTLVLGLNVVAVVHLPWGSHPSPTQGYRNRDHKFYLDYHEETRTYEGFQRWLKKWVLDVRGHEGYLKLLGEERLSTLTLREPALAFPIPY